MVDEEFGKLVIRERMPNNKHGQKMFRCECQCGNFKVISYMSLKAGTKSCGCLRKENAKKLFTKHGLSGRPEYSIWLAMIQRCHNPNSHAAEDYSERGIVVCDRWRTSFPNFFEDMGERPEGSSIERKENNGPYCRENCCWSTPMGQVRNRRTTNMVTYQGTTKPIAEWAEITGIKRATLYRRIYSLGWSIEEAFTTETGTVRKEKRVRPTEKANKDQARHAVQIAMEYGKLMKPSCCEHPGCGRIDIQAHHHAGYDKENHLNVQWVCGEHHPRANEVMITACGETLPLKEWARRLGVSNAVISGRLKMATWTVEEAVTIPLCPKEKAGAIEAPANS